MKKIILIALIILISLPTCASVKYIITVKGVALQNGDKAYLSFKLSQMPKDSATVANGTVTFKGTLKNPDVANLFVIPGNGTKGRRILGAQIALNGKPVSIEFTSNNVVISGGKLNTELESFMKDIRSMLKDKSIFKSYIKRNEDNILGVFFFDSFGPKFLTPDEMLDLLKDLGNYTKSHPSVKRLAARLEAAKARSVGRMYTDVEITDRDGNIHKLSDYVGHGKYIMIDFWASWCAPCRMEIPKIIPVYEKYHSKGFDIIGISLDDDKNAWLKTAEKLNIPWLQFVDTKGGRHLAAETYGVTGIPCTILFDKEGKVIASQLFSEAIEKKLEEVFN